MIRIIFLLFAFSLTAAPVKHDPSQLLQIGYQFHQEGNLEKAKGFYQNLLIREKDNFDALHLLGILHGQEENYDLAIGYFKKALKVRPYDGNALYNLGTSYLYEKRYADSLPPFQRILKIFPQNEPTQKQVLFALEKMTEGKKNSQGRLILGMGTGRSGSTSLTLLFKNQENTFSAHETPPQLPWNCEKERIDFHKKRINLLAHEHSFVADTSHWWLPYFEELVKEYPDLKAVVLKRDKPAVIKSFLKIKGNGVKGSINHWINHDGSYYAKNMWDECYPKYDVKTTRDALGKYWDEYYETAEKLAKRFPENIQIFSIEDLNDEKGQVAILKFCGFKNPITSQDLHLNKGTVSDGEHLF